MAGVVQGKSLEESVDMGHWLASLSITELGPSYVQVCFSLVSDEFHYKKKQQHPPTPNPPLCNLCPSLRS